MVLTKSTKMLFEQFHKSHQDVKIGRSRFCALRPRHVKPQSQAKYTVCLCETCEKLRLKIVSLDQRLQLDAHDQLKLKDAGNTVKITSAELGN